MMLWAQDCVCPLDFPEAYLYKYRIQGSDLIRLQGSDHSLLVFFVKDLCLAGQLRMAVHITQAHRVCIGFVHHLTCRRRQIGSTALQWIYFLLKISAEGLLVLATAFERPQETCNLGADARGLIKSDR